MTIPESLLARKAELERGIEQSEREATMFNATASWQRAELRGLTLAIEAYTAAEVVVEPAPTVRALRRDLRAMVMATLARCEGPASSEWLRSALELKLSQVEAITRALQEKGKIVRDVHGWVLFKPEFIEQAAAE